MKLFKQSIAFSLFLCLSAGHENVYAAASSVPVEPAIEYHDSGLPTRLADYLAETSFFKWLGNKITTYALEAHEAQQSNTIKHRQALVKKKYAKHYFETGKPVDVESLEKELGECKTTLPEYHPTSSEYYPTSSATLAPKTFGQWALVIMCITAPFLPQITITEQLQAAGPLTLEETLTSLAKHRIEKFDVCLERLSGQQCCTVHDNTHIECCFIMQAGNQEICESIHLRGYPTKTHTMEELYGQSGLFDIIHSRSAYDAVRNGTHPIHRSLKKIITKYTTKSPISPTLYLARPPAEYEAYYYNTSASLYATDPNTVHVSWYYYLCSPTELSHLLAHEVGHHQQFGNNYDLFYRIPKALSEANVIISSELVRRFNREDNADILGYLVMDGSTPGVGLLAAHFKYEATIYPYSDARCKPTTSLTKHPSLYCRLSVLAELDEHYHPLVKSLEEKARAAQATSANPANSSSSN
ncbi:hypothetical protein K2W90_06345 [Candidatus Babeliales bacterium]|nr:hypothetical protein [Candidatus Babeliales bacterium]